MVFQRVTVLAGLALLAFACGDKFTAGEPAAGGSAGQGGSAIGATSGSGVGGDDAPDGGVETGGGAPVAGNVTGGRGGVSSVAGGAGKPNIGGSNVGGSNVGGSDSGGGGGSGGNIAEMPPIPLAGLEVWFDANVGVTQTNGGVSRWKDRSGYQRDALQTALNYRPKLDTSGLNGKPALVFAGDQYLKLPSLPGDFSQGVSIFAVGQEQTDSGSCSAIFEASNGSEIDDVHLGFWQNAVLYEVAADYFSASEQALILGEPQLLAAVHQTSGSLQVRRNSNALGEDTFALPATIARQFVYIGRTEYADCDLYTGTLAELLVYDRAVSDPEVIEIETYLQKKWGCCAE